MPDKSFLASGTLAEHLLRGVVGIGTLWYAIDIANDHSWLSLILGVIALLAFKGCPICWTIGLIETVYRRFSNEQNDSTAID